MEPVAVRPAPDDAVIATAHRGAPYPAYREPAIRRVRDRAAVRIVRRGDADYPQGLDDLPDAPPALAIRGFVPRGPAVAIVGSRAASPYGIAQAAALAADLARLGVTVVSGLARGIDAAAHRGALEAGGPSVAVVPGRVDAVAPSHHQALADALCAARGGVLSEDVEEEAIYKGSFLRRNRLIAALAGATVVVEAAARSGALSTAAAARRLGRPLLAVPGDVDRPTSRGTHALLRAGAALCESAADVMAALRPADAASPAARIAARLGPRPASVETLARETGLGVADTLAALLALEWAGGAVPCPGQRWRRP